MKTRLVLSYQINCHEYFKFNIESLIREAEFNYLYKAFMLKYLSVGYKEEVIESKESEIYYYISYYCMSRTESSSTPLCVVFNTMSLTSTGKSLNSLPFNGGEK